MHTITYNERIHTGILLFLSNYRSKKANDITVFSFLYTIIL